MLDSLLRSRYNLIASLGAGGFGQTYLAEDLASCDRSSCVVKQFKPVKEDEHFLKIARRLFHTEVKMLEKLGQHPQIPTFLDFFEENGEFYLVQEFIDGQSLNESFIASRLTEADAIDLLRDVLEVLQFVHAHQVIHRDIKPSNLIQRQTDGKIVLIDFGAVKEISTQILSETEQQFTVSIGTQGYTPNEQLAGRPGYCSDLYALGVTIIQGVTGLQPTQLAVDPETGDLIWQDRVVVSSGLQSILEKMVRYHFNQRYQSAQAVIEALDRLAAMPLESTVLPPALVMPSSLLHHPIGDELIVDSPVKVPQPQKGRSKRAGRWQIVAVAALAVTGLLAGLRQMAWLQTPELAVYDQLTRLRPSAGMDPRLLIVEIREADLQQLQRATPSDQDVATVIQTLQQFQPRVIGLDLYRELPQASGHEALMQALRSPNLVAIMKLGNATTLFDIPPPANLPAEQLGFNDFPIDDDGAIRRNLLYATIAEQNLMSFSLRLATKYLQAENLAPKNSDKYAQTLQIGSVHFRQLDSNFGGYERVDAAGYQILLNYRSPRSPARTVAFTEVLQGRVDPNWVKDKVVLIGTTAVSSRDLFYTPFSSGQNEEHLMPGVAVHAQLVSQVLSAVLDRTPLTWVIPDSLELIWIGIWALGGGSLAWFLRHPLLLIGSNVMGFISLAGITYLIFSWHGWLPSVSPLIAFGLTEATVLSWRSTQSEQDSYG